MKIILAFSLLICGILHADDDNGIVDYVSSRDKSALILMIEQSMQQLNFTDNNSIVRFFNRVAATPESHCKVMRQEEKTVGYIRYLYTSVPSSASPSWHISTIVVDQNCRRCGHATTMIQSAIDAMIALGADRITINVRADNEPAKILYEQKFGFQEFYKYPDTVNLALELYINK